MKVGIIRCMQTEDYCPGTADFKAVREKTGAFSGIGEKIEVIGFINCGGCSGKKAILRARELVKRGAVTLVFASCIQKGTPHWASLAFKNAAILSFDMTPSLYRTVTSGAASRSTTYFVTYFPLEGFPISLISRLHFPDRIFSSTSSFVKVVLLCSFRPPALRSVCWRLL